MPRNALRLALFLLLLAAAILTPLVVSGYAELLKASGSGTYLEAARRYQLAAQRLPWRADLYELSGHAYYHAEEYALAQAPYQKAYRCNALSPDGWVAWGDVLYLQGDHAEAARIWEQGLEQENPSDKLYSRLGQIYKEDGEYSKAAQVLQRYVAVYPQDASARYRLGLLMSLTDPEGALSELITASQLDPELTPAVEALRSALNQASLRDSPSERLVLIGRGLGIVQEWELARLAFDSAVEEDENNAEAWAWLGEAKHHAGLEGREELDRAYELGQDLPTVRGLRGLYFQRMGNFRNALIEFQAAALRDAQNPAWQVSMGETYSKLGDLIRALDSYQAATRLAPEDAEYWRMLALFCAQNNVNIKTVGIPAAQKAVVLDQEDPASLDLLGWLLFLDKRYEESERILLQALGLDPENATAHLYLGMLYMQTRDRAAAQDHFVEAHELGNPEAEAILSRYFP